MNRSAKGLLIIVIILLWMVLVWRIADDLPNFPNFSTIQYIAFKENSNTDFTNNYDTATHYGGAVSLRDHSIIVLDQNPVA